MGNSMRTAAVLRIAERDQQRLFGEELLFKPLIAWIADALCKAGVDELLLISDRPYAYETSIGHRFSTYARTDLHGVRDALKGLAESEKNCIIAIADTVLFDQTVITELIDTLTTRRRVTLTSGGAELGVCGLSGEDASDVPLIESVLLGKSTPEGFYELDCLDAGILGHAIRSLEDLSRSEELLRDEVNHRHMENGVRFIGPDTSFISPDAEIGPGSTILPNTIIKGASVIGQDCKIGPNTVISSCTIGDRTEVNASQLNESVIGASVKIGPFAYIRPGCVVADNIRIGDFVELKKARIGEGTKISHLTYVGDAEVGQHVNFGCGTVTANYDGVAKHLTVIEDGAFIGCNTNLIAPVRVGKNATTAAGTTVTADVPEGSLAIGRVRQTIKADWNKYRKK